MNTKYNMNAPCLFGLESILSFELKRIGAENIQSDNGRLSFSGNATTLIDANLWLRTAERVNIVLATFSATSFTQLFDGVGRIPFEDYIGEADSFPVKGWSIDSKLESVPSCQSIIKKSVVRRLQTKFNREIFPETGNEYQISFSLHKDEVTIMLDSTGTTLHKRGYRKNANIAPIRETLAAGIVDLARIRPDTIVYDPTCGSGTLLIEAAQKALNIAPGLNRDFAAEGWGFIPKRLWQERRQAAKAAIDKEVAFHGYGSDIDRNILNVARDNARLAGVEDRLTFSSKDVSQFEAVPPAVVLANPPYGERMMEMPEAVELYEAMGKAMPKLKDVSYFIIGPPEEFESAFGRRADKRRKLYNGMLECQLYMYFR